MPDQADLYAVLGVSPQATQADLIAAYSRLVAGSANDPVGIARFTDAFQNLMDPLRRAAYDQSLETGPAETTPAAPNTRAPGVEVTEMVAAPALSATVGAIPVSEDSPTLGGSRPPGAPPAAVLPSNVTYQPATLMCPVCQTANMGSVDSASEYCQDCGFLLSQTPGEAPQAAGPVISLVMGDRDFPLHEGGNIVGRQDADVMLSDATVSRLHAKLTLAGDQLSVEDTNSTNGTQVNGKRLASGGSSSLKDGDRLMFGQVALVVRGAGSPPVAEDVPADVSEPPEPSAEPEAARLVAVPGGNVYPIRKFPATVGRRADNDVVIVDPYISGRHAEILQEDGMFIVRDQHSTNGTIVGHDPLDPGGAAPLLPDGAVQFGKRRFQFIVTVAPAADPGPEPDSVPAGTVEAEPAGEQASAADIATQAEQAEGSPPEQWPGADSVGTES